jgi:hypothetical protein
MLVRNAEKTQPIFMIPPSTMVATVLVICTAALSIVILATPHNIMSAAKALKRVAVFNSIKPADKSAYSPVI